MDQNLYGVRLDDTKLLLRRNEEQLDSVETEVFHGTYSIPTQDAQTLNLKGRHISPSLLEVMKMAVVVKGSKQFGLAIRVPAPRTSIYANPN